MTIRPMTVRDEPAVAALYALCHPTWTARPARFYTADNQTLLAVLGDLVLGYAVLGTSPAGAILHDSGVHPDWRGKGLAGLLHTARLEAASSRGDEFAIGFTWAGNTPMVRLLARLGFVQTLVHDGFFPENDPPADALVYVKRLRPAG